MPHKHKRRDKDEASFELPPSELARPLAVGKSARVNDASTNRGLKRKRGKTQTDDAPRAFKRLMAIAGGKKVRSGLDDGNDKTSKKAKPAKSKPVDTVPSTNAAASEMPTIRPGERMSEFNARVDQTLPLGGLINKSARGGKDPLGLKVWRTKKERKMHKLYDEWREQDQKIKDKREEELEDAEEEEMENEENGVKWKVDFESTASTGGKKKRKGKKRMLGEANEREEDPWEELKRKRAETKPALHEQAQAPPVFSKALKKKLTVGGAAVDVDGIPKAAGSLRRREELQGIREDIVSAYRARMNMKKPQQQSE